ncbi:hypothetical protein DPMN_037045 [Dreissena polymorpha]|uniref:CCHC-type domain-containing protein n=1 Tax=Dreissena polymorpha TaxID=45954 RepID=A0A9D4MCR2_DREPO|nr:hypothetical protein DPMN_037045 [Dreissena polymorpha]
MTSSRFHPYAAAPMRGLYGGGRGGLFRGNRPYNSGGPSSASATGPGSCFTCGEFSHFRRNCPYVPRGQNTQTSTSGSGAK